MKKILTIALGLTAVGTMSAQEAVVKQAEKLAGKIDKIEEARSLIKQAIASPETSGDVNTYFVAGKIEFDAFDEAYKKKLINPNDESASTIDMGNELVNGYNYFLLALPLDSVPNEKGQVKPKHSKKMLDRINGHHNDYFTYGGELYNNKHYYPEAYNAFMIYGDMTNQPWASAQVKATPDTTAALAYYYAGIGAFSGNALEDAAKAFSKARLKGITDPQSYVYEIASWQNIALRDSTKEELAKKKIQEVAEEGYKVYGIQNPLFINNLVNTLIQGNKNKEAIDLVSAQIQKTPNEPFLYGLRAYVYEREHNDDAALADYEKAVSFDNVDVETLVNAIRKIYNKGVELRNNMDTNGMSREQIKNDYFLKAMDVAKRAQAADPGNPTVDDLIDTIQYALENYF